MPETWCKISQELPHCWIILELDIISHIRKLDVLQKTADEIQEKTGKRVRPWAMNWPDALQYALSLNWALLIIQVVALACDVRESGSVREVVSECIEQMGLPHLVVNNAAGNFISPTERLSTNAWRTIVDIVLNGTANVTLDIGKRLIAANQGL